MTVDPGEVLTVLTWNVQRSGLERAHGQAAWLRQQAADVIVLTEVGPTAGAVLPKALAAAGYVTTGAHDLAAGAGVVLAARGGPLVPVRAPVRTMVHRCQAAVLRLGGWSVGLVGLYVPSRGGSAGRNVAKRQFQSAVTEALPRLRDHLSDGSVSFPVVIAGDLNVVEPGHDPHHDVYGAWEYDFYRSFAAHGFVDAFRSTHPGAVEHSWFGRRSGLGYRFDHVFCSADHVSTVSRAHYLHDPREAGLSDHSAMVVGLARP